MSDLDEDLLALAGAVDDDVPARPSKKRTLSKRKLTSAEKKRKTRDELDDDLDDLDDLDSAVGGDSLDEDDNSDGLDDERYVKPKRSSASRTQSVSASVNEDEDDEDAEFVNPYPLMGKYKNEEDMAKLEAMNEIDREQLLFERSQEMQRFHERSYLAQRLKDSRRPDKDKAKLTRSSARDTPKGMTVKRSQLTELKKKRQEKTVRARQKSDDPSYDSTKLRYDEEEEEDDYEPEVDDDEVVWSETPAHKELELDDCNKTRLGRTALAKYCHYPEFDRVAQDCFVRVNIGYNQHKAANIYRMCQIKGVIESKTYTFSNRTVNTSLLVTHGSSEKIFEMGICSDQPFTEEEFLTWKKTVVGDKLSLPSKRLIDSKFQQLQKMRDRTLTPDEVNAMIDLRQKLSSNVASNSVMRKTMLNQKRLIAVASGDLDEVAEIDAQIASIDQRQTIKLSTALDSPLQLLSKVNERNRRANQDDIRKAEMKNTEERRKAKISNKPMSDPFSRLKTNPRMYYDSNGESGDVVSTADTVDDDDDDAEVDKKMRLAEKLGKQSMSQMDDVIANTEFEIDIDLDL